MSAIDAYPLYKKMTEEFIAILDKEAQAHRMGGIERKILDAHINRINSEIERLGKDQHLSEFKLAAFEYSFTCKSEIKNCATMGMEKEHGIYVGIAGEWEKCRKKWEAKILKASEMPAATGEAPNQTPAPPKPAERRRRGEYEEETQASESEEINFSCGDTAAFAEFDAKPEQKAMAEKRLPVSSMPLAEFLKVLEHYHDPKTSHPYYCLPARESVYFMLTGKGNQDAIDWREEHGPSHGFRLKLFVGKEEAPKAISPEALRQGAEPAENVRVRLGNVASLFLNDKPKGSFIHVKPVPWQDVNGEFMEMWDVDDYLDWDCRQHVERLYLESDDSFWEGILKGFVTNLEEKASADKVGNTESLMRRGFAAKLELFLRDASERKLTGRHPTPNIEAAREFDNHIKNKTRRYDAEGSNEERITADIVLSEWKGWIGDIEHMISEARHNPLPREGYPGSPPAALPGFVPASFFDASANPAQAEAAHEGLGIPAQPHDYDHALNQDAWRAWEAFCWLQGNNPRHYRGGIEKDYPLGDLIMRAIKAGRLTAESTSPRQWIEWAISKGFGITERLRLFVEVRPCPTQEKPKPEPSTAIDPRRFHHQAFGTRITVAEMRERWGHSDNKYLDELARLGELIPWCHGEAIHIKRKGHGCEFGIPPNAELSEWPTGTGSNYDPDEIVWVDTLPDDAYYGLPFVLEYEEKNPYMKPKAEPISDLAIGIAGKWGERGGNTNVKPLEVRAIDGLEEEGGGEGQAKPLEIFVREEAESTALEKLGNLPTVGTVGRAVVETAQNCKGWSPQSTGGKIASANKQLAREKAVGLAYTFAAEDVNKKTNDPEQNKKDFIPVVSTIITYLHKEMKAHPNGSLSYLSLPGPTTKHFTNRP